MGHSDPGMNDDPESPLPPVPEERGKLIPPIRRPPTARGTGTPDPSGMFSGRFRIESRLAWPHMWTAFLAHDLAQDRRVVLRLFRLPADIDCHRFFKAALPAASLHHPNILPNLEFGEADQWCFCICPYLSGEWLCERLQRERQLTVPDALELMQQVVTTLNYAHSLGIIHGDLSPSSLYLTSDRLLVGDFGLALALQEASGQGTGVGTLPYMSPERLAGSHQPDPRADVYSLGALLYELLIGTPPDRPLKTHRFTLKRTRHGPPSARQVRPDVPVSVDAALRRALAPALHDRFPSAAAFAAALIPDPAAGPAQPGLTARLGRLLGLTRPSA